MSLELVIFDLDGVLFDSGDLVVAAVGRAVARLSAELGRSVAPPAPERIRALMGVPNREYARGMGLELDEAGWRRFQALVQEEEVACIESGDARMPAGIPPLLDALEEHSVRCAVASNCGRPYLLAFLDYFNLAERFTLAVCNDDAPDGDKAELLDLVLEHQAVLASEAIYLGDRRRDLDAARAVGTGFIACLWGFGDPQEFPAGTSLCATPAEAAAVLTALIRGGTAR
ncbi:MAG TPA: HAD family hydrolase [Acidobacteriota bacterium]|nr:HAD family hydrolase [Acidobacteriota bacterium]HQM62885.1 HAD family hydrolase [Acidobacteriota bacterium]